MNDIDMTPPPRQQKPPGGGTWADELGPAPSGETKRKDGGPAFPAIDRFETAETSGMSLRDWFAGQALAGMIGTRRVSTSGGARLMSKAAYELADAMLGARDAE